MHLPDVLFILFALVFCALTLYHYSRCKKPAVITCILISVRLLFLAGLAILFYNPVFYFNRILSRGPSCAVYIDNSQSMRLFSMHTSLPAVFDSLDSRTVHGKDGKGPYNFFIFGDSLRPLINPGQMDFRDRTSSFSNQPSSHALQNPGIAVIVSDGNWTNGLSPQSDFNNKECYFIPMQHFRPQPYARMSIIQAPRISILDSTALLTLRVQGFTQQSISATLTALEHGKKVYMQTIKLDSGFFEKSISLPLPGKLAGQVPATILFQSADSLLYTHAQWLHTVVPKKRKALIYAPVPTLNKRFLSLALHATEEWEHSDSIATYKTADAVFFCAWDSGAEHLFNRIGPHTCPVFTGCVPCATPALRTPHPQTRTCYNSFVATKVAGNALDFPPLRILDCISGHDAHTEDFLFLVNPDSGQISGDTLPLIYSTTINNRPIIVSTPEQLWQWDFLPYSLDRQNPENFSTILISIVKQELLSRTTQSFLVYPSQATTTDLDSVRYDILLPFQASQQTQSTLNFSIFNEMQTSVFDTGFTVSGNDFHKRSLHAPPLKPGNYICRASLISSLYKAECIDTLIIEHNNVELQVTAQNTALLKQFALPIGPLDNVAATDSQVTLHIVKEIRSIMATRSASRRVQTIRSSLRLERTWLFLLLLVGLYCAEMVLRKRFGLK